MATLIQRMYATAHFCDFNQGQGYGTHTAPNVWTYTASGDCATRVADPYGALDETAYGAARSEGALGQVNKGLFEWTFSDPPQNVTIANLTLVAYLRTSSGNTAAIDSPPEVEFFVDPCTGTRDYYGATDTVDHPCNRNTQAATGTFYRYTRAWASKPGGGAWTQAELVAGSFKAGLASDGSSHGSGIDKTTGGSAASFDVAAFWVELETTPAGLYLEPVRTVLSQQLRLLTKPTRTFVIDVPPEYGNIEPGDTIWTSHEMLPGDPGYHEWEQVPLYVIGVNDAVDPPRLTLTCLDLRTVYANYYSPHQILGVDEQNSGLARYDQGGGWETTRDQVAYAPRPGDLLYQEVLADMPCLTRYGLLCQGSSDTNYLLNSTFSAGTSNAFTAWTAATTGGGTVTQDTADYLIDTAGWQRSAKITTSSSGDAAYLYQSSTSFGAGSMVFVRAWYKNDSTSSDPMQLRILRNADSYYWDDTSSGGWVAAPVAIEFPLDTSIARYTSRQIDVGTSDTSLQIMAGYGIYSYPTGANVAHAYSIELQSGDTFSWCRRELLATTTSGIVARAEETTLLNNAEAFRILPMTRGSFELDFTPLWSHSDLADNEQKCILQHAYNGSISSAGYVLSYVRTDATNGRWSWHGALFATTSTAGTLPVAGTTVHLAGRFSYGDENQYGGTNQEFDIWVDRVKGTSFGPVVASAGLPAACVSLGVAWIGDEPTVATYADGYIKNLVIDGWRPEDAAASTTRPAMPSPTSDLLEGLLEGYMLEEASGTRAGVQGLYALSEAGTSMGSVTGIDGDAANFNATTAYLSNASIACGQSTAGVTWAVWLSRSIESIGIMGICGSGAAANPAFGLRLNANTGRPNGYIRDTSSNIININASVGSSLCDGEWRLMIMTYNEAGDRKLHIYVPALSYSLVSSGTGVSDTIQNDGGGLVLGRGYNTGYFWGDGVADAWLDHFMIWDRALTSAERTALQTLFYPF